MSEQIRHEITYFEMLYIIPGIAAFVESEIGGTLAYCHPILEGEVIIGFRFRLVNLDDIQSYEDIPFYCVDIRMNSGILFIQFQDGQRHLLPEEEVEKGIISEYLEAVRLLKKYGYESTACMVTE